MELEFINIGLIKSANIKINGLTVIGGHNSSGKSFIGKAIYTAIKALNYDILNSETKRIDSKFSELINYLLVSNYIQVKDPKSFGDKFLKLYGTKNPAESYSKMVSFIDEILIGSSEYKKDNRAQDLLDEFKNFSSEDASGENNIKRLILEHNNLIRSVFKGEYNNLLMPNELSKVVLREHNKDVLTISVEDNRTSDFIIKNEDIFKDVTLIETPIILSLVGYIRDNLAFSEKQSKLLPAYILDLVKKIVEGSYDIPTDNALFNSITETIDGQLLVDANQVMYKDKANNTHNINNTASGIKSFGVLQLLLAGGTINPNSILIIDEPEVHLHPEWQLEYGKLLVELVKNDITILVTTHSPYFLEAMKVFSDKEEISDKTNFYLGEKTDGGSEFKDVTQNLDELFEKFSTPMIKLTLEK